MSNGMDIDNLSEIVRLCELRTAKKLSKFLFFSSIGPISEPIASRIFNDKWQVDFVGGPFQKDLKPYPIDNRFTLSKSAGTSHLSKTKMGFAGPEGLRILIYHLENRHFHLSFFGVKVSKSAALVVNVFAGEYRWQGKFWEGVLKKFYLDKKFSFLWHIGKNRGHLETLGMQIVK
jgi:hypothetical protein